MFDGKAFGEEMVEIVKGYVARTVEPVLKRLAALEERQPERGEAGEKGADGKDGAPGVDGRAGADGADGKKGDAGEAGKDGEKGDTGSPGRDGKDGSDGAPGADGRDGEKGEKGEAGRDGNDGAPGEKGDAGAPGRDGERGADGVGLAGSFIDRKGSLVLTLSDGTVQELGEVVGRDGRDGENGAPGEKGADGRDGEKGADGADGKDGVDGVGFDDLEVVHDGARGFSFRFTKGERVKSFDFSLPVVLDCGVYKTGHEYEPGDAVTFGGSLWIAQAKTTERPEGGDAWRLAVKKGRDGKDAGR